MAEHHRLGVAASGRVLRYVAELGGEPLVLGTFGSAAWRVPVRDAHIGWDQEQRAARLERMCANQRLCVLPAGSAVPHAASKSLAAMLRALPGDYLSAFGVRLMAAESLTDPAARAGTVYAACTATVAFQVELVFEGADDRFDPLPHAGEIAEPALFILAVGACQQHVDMVGAVAFHLPARPGPCRPARSCGRGAPRYPGMSGE